jgi:hypothetical protein
MEYKYGTFCIFFHPKQCQYSVGLDNFLVWCGGEDPELNPELLYTGMQHGSLNLSRIKNSVSKAIASGQIKKQI